MNDKRLVTIGTIVKTHGFEGAVAVKVTAGAVAEPKINEPVFVVVDGIPVPFFIRDIYYAGGDTMLMAFDDYLTPASVLILKGCEVRYESGSTEDDLVTLEGYTLLDVNTDFSAEIVSIEEQSGQILATVRHGESEILIPLHEDLIKSINNKKKTVRMYLPDGLADLNI